MEARGGSSDANDQWTEHKTAEGKSYYHNSSTGKTVWKRPKEMQGPNSFDQQDAKQAEGSGEDRKEPALSVAEAWTEHKAGGKSYFHNAVTGETVWQRPAALGGPTEVAEDEGGHKWKYDHKGQTIKEEEAAALQNPEEDATVAPRPAPIKGPPVVYETKEAAVAAFREMMVSLHISPNMVWKDAVSIMSSDQRYLSLATTGERKETFHRYQTQRKKQVRRSTCDIKYQSC